MQSISILCVIVRKTEEERDSCLCVFFIKSFFPTDLKYHINYKLSYHIWINYFLEYLFKYICLFLHIFHIDLITIALTYVFAN